MKNCDTILNQVDFIGIGSARCATTWIFKCLNEHPQICGSKIKELNYFITDRPKGHPLYGKIEQRKRNLFNKGIESYMECFSHCPKESVRGEFTAYYMNDPKSADLIYQSFPNVKIIACLRNPIERAHSYYWFARKFLGWEKNKTFKEALKNNSEFYVEGGMYYKQLKRYFDLFPRENIGIFFVDDIKKDPIEFIQKIYSFLGVNDKFVAPSALESENSSKETRFKILKFVQNYLVKLFYVLTKKTRMYFLSDFLKKIGFQKIIYVFDNKLNAKKFIKPKINEETRKKLLKKFVDDMSDLEKLLKLDLKHWKK